MLGHKFLYNKAFIRLRYLPEKFQVLYLILFCSVGRRCELLKDFRKSMGDELKIVVTDHSEVAPAMAFADKAYKVPLIHDPE